MKNIKILVVALMLVIMAACEKEDNPTVTDARDNFTGSWSCAENSTLNGAVPAFLVTIEKSSASSNEVIIKNFYGLGTNNSAIADVAGSNITIPQQNLAGNTIKGSGYIQGPTAMYMTYTVFDGSATDSVSATLTRQ